MGNERKVKAEKYPLPTKDKGISRVILINNFNL